MSINVDGELEIAEEFTIRVNRGGMQFVEPKDIDRSNITWKKKSRFAQILIFWDAVLLGTPIFISLSVKPGLRCLWLHSAMLAECAIGLLILGILTFGKSEPDIVHGRLFTVMIGGISLQLVLYYDQPILHTFLPILMLTITIYRNFSLCKFAMVEMMVLYLVSVLYYWNVGFGDNVSVMYSVVAAGGVLGEVLSYPAS